MSWLSDWDKRIKLAIDYTKVESILYNFPVLIKLSSESGITNNDVTDVFYELETNDNRKKIAITTGDGVTQCYVEIEKWDHINEKAVLWIKIPEVSDSTDTILYLYYDNTKSDNSSYVGDTDESVSVNVWNNDYSFVGHMSTRYNSVTSVSGISNDGEYVTAAVSKGIYIDGGSSESLNCGAVISGSNYTFESFFKTSDTGKIILQDACTSPMTITLTSGTLDLSVIKREIGTNKVNNEAMNHVCYDTLNGNCYDVSDTNTGSYWQSSNTTSNWNRVDLGSENAKSIGCVNLQGLSGYPSRMIDSFKIFGSNNDSDWDELYSGNAVANTTLQEFVFDEVTGVYRYYRFNSYSNHGDSLLCMTIIHYIESESSEYNVFKTGTYNDNEFHFLTAVRRNNNDLFLFVDGQTVSGTTDSADYSNNTDPFFLGGIAGDYNTITFDEVRSSDVVRSEAWIETTYYSNMDNLITFDNPALWYYYGYIKEEGVPVSRTVNLYNRATGELISTTISNVITGYYYLTTTTSGEHFIVTFDDEAGSDYNALILDRLLPRGIE